MTKALIRQKVNAKPYVVYQFDLSYKGAIHRFYERYSTIYDFYVMLKKELKLPKVRTPRDLHRAPSIAWLPVDQ
eukprot:SAG22_NODE_10378_length_538_cov_1.583144_1_plen_74_part_00